MSVCTASRSLPAGHLSFPSLPMTTLSNTEFMSRDLYYVLNGANAVCFDVDSTLIRHEGIDLLADACGVGEKVEQL